MGRSTQQRFGRQPLVHDAQMRAHSIWHQCECDLRDRQPSFCFARNHQLPERNLPLGGDVNVKPMIASWTAQQPPECQGSLATWFDSTFHRALDWIYKGPGGGQLATETTTLGMLRNVLRYMVPE